MKKIRNTILISYNYFTSGNKRSVEAKKNILLSVVIKGLGVAINLVFVPLLLDIFSPEKYGVWLTVSSIVTWFNFLDLGLSAGFRNKFTEAITIKNTKLAKEYVSTIYSVLPVISISFLAISSISSFYLNWNEIFNTTSISNTDLRNLVLIVLSSFAVRFVFQPIGQIILAHQKPALYNSFFLIGNLISLILVIIFGYILKQKNILLLGGILAYSSVLVFIIAHIFLFNSRYKDYAPKIREYKRIHLKSLMGLGLKFFFIQISMIVVMYSTNFLIAQFCSPIDVTRYNIAQRLFSVGTMLFTILLTPMWSATTDAYIKGDIAWIKRSMSKLRQVAIYSTIITVMLLIFNRQLFRLWLHNDIEIPFSICLIEALKTIVFMFFSPFASFLNGVSKIKLNTSLVIVQTIFYIPLAYLLSVTLNTGIAGIVLAGLLIELPLRISQPIQYYKIITQTAKGIWNK